MNRRETLTVGVTAVAVVGIMGAAYGADVIRATNGARTGADVIPKPAPVVGPGFAPIPELAVAPNSSVDQPPKASTFLNRTSSSDDELDASTAIDANDVATSLRDISRSTTLSSTERDNVIWMREEEQLARDVNRVLARRWGNGPFANVAGAEATHIDAVQMLIERYGVNELAPGAVEGVYSAPTLSRLYQEFVTTGSASYIDGLKIGARIEELDIKDLKARSSTLPDIAAVYAELERGSRNHLRAFIRQLERQGVQYAPMHITRSDFDSIIGSSLEVGRTR